MKQKTFIQMLYKNLCAKVKNDDWKARKDTKTNGLL